jgi:Putative auto-transporter adhesin, head GIN domain
MKPGAGNRPVNHRSEVIVMRLSAGNVLFAVGVATGCNGNFSIGPPAIAGSGVSQEETRTVDAFHALDAGNALQVRVSVTSGAKPGVKISGDDNLVPLVESVIRDGTLILRLQDNSTISPKLPLLAEVVTNELDAVKVSDAASVKVKGNESVNRFTASASGAAQVSVEGVESSQTVASATGASHVVLSGSAASLKVGASGASQIKAQALQADDANVSISGASRVALRANNRVAGDLSGASQLDLYGSPVTKTVSTSGASRVIEKK